MRSLTGIGGYPAGIAVSPDGDAAYVLGLQVNKPFDPGIVSVLRARDGQVARVILLPGEGRRIAIAPSGRTLYVANYRDGKVYELDVVAGVVRKTINIATAASSVDVTNDGKYLVVGSPQKLQLLDPTVPTVVNAVATGGEVVSTGSNPDGSTIYVAEDRGLSPGVVRFISSPTMVVLGQLSVGPQPSALAASRNGRAVYVLASGRLYAIDPRSMTVTGSVEVGTGAQGVALTPDDRQAWVTAAYHVAVVDTATLTVTQTIEFPHGAISTGQFIGAAPALPGTRYVVEFYNANLDHYFMTQNVSEIADLDLGVHQGWSRTGQQFLAYTKGDGPAGTNPVCRFYGLPSAGLDSHFYSASREECAEVEVKFPLSWKLESPNVFEIALPNTTTGACPAGTAPVYRLWNQRVDSNHRYATDPYIVAQMVKQGFKREGYGEVGVTMCAPTVP